MALKKKLLLKRSVLYLYRLLLFNFLVNCPCAHALVSFRCCERGPPLLIFSRVFAQRSSRRVSNLRQPTVRPRCMNSQDRSYPGLVVELFRVNLIGNWLRRNAIPCSSIPKWSVSGQHQRERGQWQEHSHPAALNPEYM